MFASSPRFSVYTVAATTDPAPIQSGPSIVPTFTFDDTSTGRAPRPDVVVVPAVADPDGDQEALLREWVIDQSHRGALILGVCAGSRLLAATGILEGRRATSHWSRLGALRASHPEVNWVDGRRYVQDGRITTTAGVTSGIPGALRVMADLAGPAEARRVGGLVGYPHWSLEESVAIPVQSLTRADLPIGLNAALPWHRPTVGIAMADGVGEIELASAFEIYAVSYAATATPIATGGVAVTKHGVVVLGDTPGRRTPDLASRDSPGRGIRLGTAGAPFLGGAHRRPCRPRRAQPCGAGLRRGAHLPRQDRRSRHRHVGGQDDRLPDRSSRPSQERKRMAHHAPHRHCVRCLHRCRSATRTTSTSRSFRQSGIPRTSAPPPDAHPALKSRGQAKCHLGLDACGALCTQDLSRSLPRLCPRPH